MTIYFIKAGRNVKIGYTAGDPMRRIRALQTGNHRKLVLLAAIPGSLEDEARLHKRFDSDRVTGEWFTLSRPIKALIRSYKGWALPEKESKCFRTPDGSWALPFPKSASADDLATAVGELLRTARDADTIVHDAVFLWEERLPEDEYDRDVLAEWLAVNLSGLHDGDPPSAPDDTVKVKLTHDTCLTAYGVKAELSAQGIEDDPCTLSGLKAVIERRLVN